MGLALVAADHVTVTQKVLSMNFAIMPLASVSVRKESMVEDVTSVSLGFGDFLFATHAIAMGMQIIVTWKPVNV